MSDFLDGPAAGVSLSLRRSPLLLRVVCTSNGDPKWDALDQLSDTPAAGEDIYVYRKVKDDGTVHIDGVRNGKRFGQWLSMATYAVVREQPDDATMRDTAQWRAWCEANAETARASEAISAAVAAGLPMRVIKMIAKK